jgi:4-amino-4-deoxy-L-arabinose transferase-like glycosyltransferase
MRRLSQAVRSVPAAARWCALIAFVNAAVWAIVTPPFHVPDETGHVAYVQHLAETGDVPVKRGADPFSPELHAFLATLSFAEVVGRADERATPSEYYDSGVDAIVDDPPSPVGPGGAIETSPQPPLYYTLEAGVYLASPWQDLLHRLWLMRLLSALMAATTTLFTFLFLREVLSQPWTWTVGALAVAFQPILGFISGGVNADALLAAASAGLLFALARAFRHGLTPAAGVGIGVALAIGVLTKNNFYALLPGAVLGVALLTWRARAGRPAAFRGAAIALALLAAAVTLSVGLNLLVWDRSALGGGIENAARVAAGSDPATAAPITVREQVSYTWQLYLPKLPFMNDQFASYPLWQSFFKGWIGLFGWLDTPFPDWVYTLAAVLVVPLVALCLVALWRRRAQLRERWPELLAYAVMAAGLLVSIGVLGLRYRRDTGFAFEQARYLLPFVPLYAAGLALAARGVGARFERELGALIVVLAMAHGLFAQLLVISRFYG